MKTLQRDGIHFRDEFGRIRILRGVNLGGTSKLPTKPNGATHLKEGFFNHREVSFIGRPFPLEEADEHFTRLKAWGLDFVRFLVSWEAVEHCGPGEYDIDYLDYLVAIVDKAAEYDISMFVDFHQDVWSRFTGGDGAPGWTLEVVGFEMQNFKATGAAIVHQTHGSPFPKMRWGSNYSKLAAGTMFTVFFAGNDFAPETKIEGQSIQDYLQDHYVKMVQQVVMRLKDKPNVLGYDWMNEPSKGFIGYENISKMQWSFKHGDMPSPFQAMMLGESIPQKVDYWTLGWLGMYPIRKHKIDPKGKRAWKDGVDCIWRQNGVWDIDSQGNPVLLKPDHFSYVDGQEVNYARDYMRPMINKVANGIHEIDPDAMVFVEFDAVSRGELPNWQDSDAKNVVYAPHWYDFVTLMSKHYVPWYGVETHKERPVFGHARARRSFASDLKAERAIAEEKFGGVPTIIGEIGIPYDLNSKIGYHFDIWHPHNGAIDDYMSAVEASLVNATIWNYSADNNNAHGDNWNGEDLSIFSRDQQKNPSDINSGGRGLHSLIRPYARAIAGEPLRMYYDFLQDDFEFTFRHDENITAPTELYVPNIQYQDGCIIEVSDGTYEIDKEKQRLYYRHSMNQSEHEIRIKPRIPRPPLPRPYGTWYLVAAGVIILVIVIAIVLYYLGLIG